MFNDDFYGDKFRWFTGVVKDVGSDGRVRVRIFGIHGTEDTTRISDGDLPYAMVLFPTTGGQTSGGNASHGLVNGTWVVGFFADHEDSQQPIILGVINGGQGSVNNSPGGQAPSPSYSDSGFILTPDTGGVPSDTTQTPPTTQLTGSGNPQKIYNFFWEKITALNSVGSEASLKAICAGIIGVLQGESGPSIDPTAYNSIGAFGICQWLGPRKRKLSGPEWHGSLVSKTNAPSLEKQLDFMWDELTGQEKNVFAKMLTAQNIEDAVAFTNMFERDESCFEPDTDGITPRKPFKLLSECNRSHPNYSKKLKFGRAAYENLSYTGTAETTGHMR